MPVSLLVFGWFSLVCLWALLLVMLSAALSLLWYDLLERMVMHGRLVARI
jgi:hypothetical protein